MLSGTLSSSTQEVLDKFYDFKLKNAAKIENKVFYTGLSMKLAAVTGMVSSSRHLDYGFDSLSVSICLKDLF